MSGVTNDDRPVRRATATTPHGTHVRTNVSRTNVEKRRRRTKERRVAMAGSRRTVRTAIR
jgi:hypothetical protein